MGDVKRKDEGGIDAGNGKDRKGNHEVIEYE